MIELRGVGKRYRLGGAEVVALGAVSLSIPKGQIVAVVGPSGSGKTSLLNLVGAMDRPSSGAVEIDGVDLGTLGDSELTAFRRDRLGFVFQAFNLMPTLSVARNVEVPLLLQGRLGGRARRDRIAEMLERVGIGGYGGRKTSELSGGQRQRVAIARALVGDPRLILADEPTANLDHKTGADILTHLRALSGELGVTLVMSTHDPRVLAFVDRVVTLEDGAVVADQPASQAAEPS